MKIALSSINSLTADVEQRKTFGNGLASVEEPAAEMQERALATRLNWQMPGARIFMNLLSAKGM